MENVVRDAVISFPGGEIDEVKLEILLKRHSWVLSTEERNVSVSSEAPSSEPPDKQLRKACQDPKNQFSSGRVNKKAVADCLKMDRHHIGKTDERTGHFHKPL